MGDRKPRRARLYTGRYPQVLIPWAPPMTIQIRVTTKTGALTGRDDDA